MHCTTSFWVLHSTSSHKGEAAGTKDEGTMEPKPRSGAVWFKSRSETVTGKMIQLLLSYVFIFTSFPPLLTFYYISFLHASFRAGVGDIIFVVLNRVTGMSEYPPPAGYSKPGQLSQEMCYLVKRGIKSGILSTHCILLFWPEFHRPHFLIS